MNGLLVIHVDIDDTLVRSVGTKRIPMSAVIAQIKSLAEEGAKLHAWSSGGAEYARDSARELGIFECFMFLPEPQIVIDDQAPRVEAPHSCLSNGCTLKEPLGTREIA